MAPALPGFRLRNRIRFCNLVRGESGHEARVREEGSFRRKIFRLSRILAVQAGLMRSGKEEF